MALAAVDLVVPAGQTLLLVGPNGAGKSTLLRIAATLLAPTFGSARVLGQDVVRERAAIRRRIELLGHRARLYDDLTPAEYLGFVAALEALDAAARIEGALGRTGLAPVRNERIRTLSQGTRQRLALARLCLRRPDLLLLDEPYAGLDASAKDLVDDVIAAARAERRSVVVATHDADRAARLADRTVALDDGRVVADEATS